MYHQRVFYHSTVKGRQHVNSDQYNDFVHGKYATLVIREGIVKNLQKVNAYNPTNALSAAEIADLYGCSATHIRDNMRVLAIPGFVLSCKDKDNPRLTRYYLNTVHIAPVGVTELESAVDKYYKEKKC